MPGLHWPTSEPKPSRWGTGYKITGTKIWISGGEHELSENIIHMVLAKTPDGPPGVRGISFSGPKWSMTTGRWEKNNIALAGLDHKMGRAVQRTAC